MTYSYRGRKHWKPFKDVVFKGPGEASTKNLSDRLLEGRLFMPIASNTASRRNVPNIDFPNNMNFTLVFRQELYKRMSPSLKKKSIISNWWEERIRTSSCMRTLLVPHLSFFGHSPFLPPRVVTGHRQGSGFNPVSTFSYGISSQNASCESCRLGYTSEILCSTVNRGGGLIIASRSSASGQQGHLWVRCST